jgi:drug/metabolite transporter (DMT)-like permease
MLAWRFAIAALLLGTVAAATDRRALVEGARAVPRFAALSLTGYGAASVCFFFALRHATASVVTVLLYAYPAMVAVADSLLRRRQIAGRVAGAIALTFVGCAMAVGALQPGVTVSAAGVALGLGAALGYATFTLLSERMTMHPRLVLMTYTFALSSIGIGAVVGITGASLSPIGWAPRLWAILGLIVLLPTVIAVALFLRGLRELGAARTALVSTREPVFTIALAALVLGERLTLVQSAGAVLVLVGIVLAEWPEERRSRAD